MLTTVQIVALFCTGLCTAIAVLSTIATRSVGAVTLAVSLDLRKQAAEHDLIVDRMSAIERRQNKLAGTVYRDRRQDQGDAMPLAETADGAVYDPPRGFEKLDPQFEAMVALQNATRAP